MENEIVWFQWSPCNDEYLSFFIYMYAYFFYHLANEDGRFVEEIVPVAVKGKKGPEEFKVDEHPKPNSTIEQLTKLAPVFKKDGTITAANASVRHFCLQNTLFYFY